MPVKKSTSKDILKDPQFFIKTGLVLLIISLILFVLIFKSVIREELSYTYKNLRDSNISEDAKTDIEPIDTNFGIVIPKINANAPIVKNVDPNDPILYQRALAKGVAHARGTHMPGEVGTMFLFAHSSVDFYVANQFNSIFYLIHKLEKGDEIFVYYGGEKYTYAVDDVVKVSPESVEYLKADTTEQKIRLMTCWPPGTTLQRLIVEGSLIPNN